MEYTLLSDSSTTDYPDGFGAVISKETVHSLNGGPLVSVVDVDTFFQNHCEDLTLYGAVLLERGSLTDDWTRLEAFPVIQRPHVNLIHAHPILNQKHIVLVSRGRVLKTLLCTDSNVAANITADALGDGKPLRDALESNIQGYTIDRFIHLLRNDARKVVTLSVLWKMSRDNACSGMHEPMASVHKALDDEGVIAAVDWQRFDTCYQLEALHMQDAQADMPSVSDISYMSIEPPKRIYPSAIQSEDLTDIENFVLRI